MTDSMFVPIRFRWAGRILLAVGVVALVVETLNFVMGFLPYRGMGAVMGVLLVAIGSYLKTVPEK